MTGSQSSTSEVEEIAPVSRKGFGDGDTVNVGGDETGNKGDAVVTGRS